MRSDEPTRHGRVADALIAGWLRELAADERPHADTTRLPAPVGANREPQGAPLGAQMRPTEAGIECALE